MHVHLDAVHIVREGRLVVRVPDWSIRRGDRWALVGRNGSGKSTLLDVLRGWRDPTEGACRIAPGLDVTFVPQQREAAPAGTLEDMVNASLSRHQEAEARVRDAERRLAEGHGTLEEVAEANEAFERAGGYEARRVVERALQRVLPDTPFSVRLSDVEPALRHRAALAVALARPGDVVILDEPSNTLDVTARAWLQDRLARLPAHVTLIVASHDRALLAHASQQTAWIEEGALQTARTGFDTWQVQRGMSRVDAKADRPRKGGSGSPPREVRAVLRARNLAVKDRFDDVGFDLPAGETWALLGANGSGASALLDLLAARDRADRPDAEVRLRPGARVFHADAVTRGLSSRPVREQLEAWVHAPRAASLLALVGLPAERWDALPDALSGGERARASLALLLASEPDVVLLDEPERDLDLAGLTLLEQVLRDAGTAGLVVTHDLRLAEAVGEATVSLVEGRWVTWRGGVAGWRAGRRQREEDLPVLPLHDEVPEVDAPSIDALEEAFLEVEGRLADPTVLSERDRVRLEARRADLLEARMVAYDAQYPAPMPRFRAVEPPLTLHGDVAGGVLTFQAGQWPVAPQVTVVGDVAHVTLPDPPDAVWLPWAREAALRAILGVVFPALGVSWVQTPAWAGAVPVAPFERLDAAWWVASQEAWWASWTHGATVRERASVAS